MKKRQSLKAWNAATSRYVIVTILITIATVIWLASYAVSPVDSLPEPGIDRFPGSGVAEEGHLPDMTGQDYREQMQHAADRGIFAFKINARPVFNGGDSEGTLRIENPKHNIYPFVVRIFLSATEEEIYNSGGILPNHHIDTARLTRALPKGEHAATAYIYAYDPDTSVYEGKTAVELTIITL